MCVAIALAWSSLPTEMLGRPDLARRIHDRCGEKEIQFHYRDRRPRLPIWRGGQLEIVRWGNGNGRSLALPRTGWTWQESIEQGTWQNLEPETVDIPATLGLERGTWFTIRQGIRGLLVPDERGNAVVYMICEPPNKYYRNMTGGTRMPIFIEQRM